MAEIIKVKCSTRYINEQMFNLVYVTFNENIFRHIDDDFINEITKLFFYVKIWERQDRTTIGILTQSIWDFDYEFYAINISKNLVSLLSFLQKNCIQIYSYKTLTYRNYDKEPDHTKILLSINEYADLSIDGCCCHLKNYHELFPIGTRSIIYESVRKVKEGYYAVKQGNLWGVVNNKGDKVTDIKYSSINFIKKNSYFVLEHFQKDYIDNYTDTYDKEVNIGTVFLYDKLNFGYEVMTTEFDKIIEKHYNTIILKEGYFMLGETNNDLAYFTYDGKQMTEFGYEAFEEKTLQGRFFLLGYKFNYIGDRVDFHSDDYDFGPSTVYDLHNEIYDAYDEFGNRLFKGFTSIHADQYYLYVNYDEYYETHNLFSMDQENESQLITKEKKTVILDKHLSSIIPTEIGTKLSLKGVFYDNANHCFYYCGTHTKCPLPAVKILKNGHEFLKIEFIEIPSGKQKKAILRKIDNAICCMFGDIFYCESDMFITVQDSLNCDWLDTPLHLTTDNWRRIIKNQELQGNMFGISSIEKLLLPYEYERIYYVGNSSFIIHHYQKRIGIFVDNKVQLSCDYDFVTVPVNGFSFVGKATDFLNESVYAVFLYDIQEDVLFSVNNNVSKEELIEAIHSGALKIDINREARSRNDISICDHKLFSVDFKSQFTLRPQSQNIRISYDLPYCVYTSSLMSEEEIPDEDDDYGTDYEDKYTYEDALYDGLGGEMSAFVNLGF